MRKGHTKHKKINPGYLICFLLLWTVQMAVSFFFCTQKTGFHEDEYYTYYSTARTNGFYVNDGQWMDREVYGNEFVVLPEQRFQYGLVKQVQSWDVHPPMYYWVFHTVASLVPGVFSKWIGLTVNLFFHGINMILLSYLSFLIGVGDRKLALSVTLFYGLSPAAMSGVVFIRMYEMLTTFVLLCAVLHIRAVKERAAVRYPSGERGDAALPVRGFLIPVMLVTYTGFLTHYYYFIFLFYLAVIFNIWLLWRDRHIWNCVRYAVSQGIALGLAVLTYPSCLGQMFRGQRGAQATANFFDVSNTIGRVRFFVDLMDRYVCGRLFWGLLSVILLSAIIAGWRIRKASYVTGRRDDGRRLGAEYFILLFAIIGYFLTVSKTALLLGETSNRYQLPVYGIIVLLAFAAVRELWCQMSGMAENPQSAWPVLRDNCRKNVGICVALICMLAGLLSAWREEVIFLYPEDSEQTAFAQECAGKGIPVIYFYQTGDEWCIWSVANELFAYPQVYFAAAGSEGVISEEKIQNADALVVYLAAGADEKKNLQRVWDGAPTASAYQWECVFEEKYCNVYYLHRDKTNGT